MDWTTLPPLLDVRAAADLLQVHPNTVKRWIKSGKLPAFKAGRKWTVDRAALRRLLNATAVRAPTRDAAFLTGLGPDLRTPLNAILGYVDVLAQVPALAHHEGLPVIRESAQQVLALTEELVTFFHLRAGTLTLRPSDVILPHFLAQVGGGFAYTLTEALPDAVQVDASRLRQVLRTLAAAGSPTVTWRVTATDAAPGHARLTFTAEGLTTAQARLLLAPERGAASTALRMANARALLALLGGTLHADDAGAVVCALTVPLAAPRRTVTGYRGPRRHILVVDDRAHSRTILGGMLTRLGFEPLMAQDAATGIVRARTARPALILLARVLPERDGAEIARTLRARSAGSDVPLIALTASRMALPEDTPFDGALGKPVALDDLVALLDRHLAPDWIYAPDDGPPEPPIDRTPAAETLAHLRAYARAGDFPSLLDIAAELAPAYPAFADVVARRARAFDAQGVLRVCGEGRWGWTTG
jgi:excisionase family DNA binding protein